LGTVLLYAGLFVAQPAIEDAYGLFLEVGPPTRIEIIYLGAVVVAGAIAGLIPALRALRLSLADGMIVRS
jgi:putative ABC transport system permease protein